MSNAADEIVRFDSVYKIFGPRPRGRAYELAKLGIGKNEVQRLSGHVMGLDNVNFSVKRGELFVIMGLSGSGKSTAIRMVNKLHEVTVGEVWVDGVNVQELSGAALQEFRREKMGMVFQHFALFPHRSVIDNVGYGLKVRKVPKEERDEASLKALALTGLEAYAHNAPSELSGGMQQRVGLARALAADPDVLLMDEAFSALDPLIRRQMQDEMLAIQSELHKTIIFITHDLNEALRIGDRVCIMKDGAVVQIGTPEEILTQPATGYVAEFVQDVDQGRVIQAHEVMTVPAPVTTELTLAAAMARVGDRAGAFVIDDAGKPIGLLTVADGLRAVSVGSSSIDSAVRTDFESALATATLNTVYAKAGRGLPIAVTDDAGVLIGNLDPQMIMEEMGRVEQLIDGFEREVFM